MEANKEGHPCLLSSGAPDNLVRHRIVTADGPVLISFLFWHRRPLQLRSSWHTGHCSVHTGQSGAPCRPLARATRRPRIAQPTIALAAVGSPDSPVHHRTVTVAVRCVIAFQTRHSRPLQLRARWRFGQSGAPYRPLARATHRPRIARPTVALAAVGSPDSSVNYSRTPPNFPESGLFTGVQPGAPDTVWCTTGQSGVPD